MHPSLVSLWFYVNRWGIKINGHERVAGAEVPVAYAAAFFRGGIIVNASLDAFCRTNYNLKQIMVDFEMNACENFAVIFVNA